MQDALLPLRVVARYQRNRRRSSPIKTDWKKDLVYLYQFPAGKTIPNLSPYCLKLETWLRMAKINYEYVPAGISLNSREGLCPFVELNGVEYCDSALIIRDLSSLFQVKETSLDSELQAVGHAFEKMVECNTFWSYAHCRMVEQTETVLSEPVVGQEVPSSMKFFLLRGIRKKLTKKLDAIGIGKHSREEIVNIGLEDLRSLSSYLANKPYLLGDQITKFDCSLFGCLAQILYVDIACPHKQLIIGECGNIKRYLDRIKAAYWQDWDQICLDRPVSFSEG